MDGIFAPCEPIHLWTALAGYTGADYEKASGKG